MGRGDARSLTRRTKRHLGAGHRVVRFVENNRAHVGFLTGHHLGRLHTGLDRSRRTGSGREVCRGRLATGIHFHLVVLYISRGGDGKCRLSRGIGVDRCRFHSRAIRERFGLHRHVCKALTRLVVDRYHQLRALACHHRIGRDGDFQSRYWLLGNRDRGFSGFGLIRFA